MLNVIEEIKKFLQDKDTSIIPMPGRSFIFTEISSKKSLADCQKWPIIKAIVELPYPANRDISKPETLKPLVYIYTTVKNSGTDNYILERQVFEDKEGLEFIIENLLRNKCNCFSKFDDN